MIFRSHRSTEYRRIHSPGFKALQKITRGKAVTYTVPNSYASEPNPIAPQITKLLKLDQKFTWGSKVLRSQDTFHVEIATFRRGLHVETVGQVLTALASGLSTKALAPTAAIPLDSLLSTLAIRVDEWQFVTTCTGLKLSHLPKREISPFLRLFLRDQKEVLRAYLSGEREHRNLWFSHEADLMVETHQRDAILIPKFSLLGPWTLRSLSEIPQSSTPVSPAFLKGLVLTKKATLIASFPAIARAIGTKRADAILAGVHELAQMNEQWLIEELPVGAIQGGVGTAFFKVAGETISNLAIRNLDGRKGDYTSNQGINPQIVGINQSGNDVVPSAIKIGLRAEINPLLEKTTQLEQVLLERIREFEEHKYIILVNTEGKPAGLLFLADIFDDYHSAIKCVLERLNRISNSCLELTLGGTLVGAGYMTDHDYLVRLPFGLREATGEDGWRFPDNFLFATRDPADFDDMAADSSWIANRFLLIADELWDMLQKGTLNHPKIAPNASNLPLKTAPHYVEIMRAKCIQISSNASGIRHAMQVYSSRTKEQLPLIGNYLFGITKEFIDLLDAAIKLFEGLQADPEQMKFDITRDATFILQGVAAKFPHVAERLMARTQGYLSTLGKPPNEQILMEALRSSAETLDLDPDIVESKFREIMKDLPQLLRPRRRRRG